MLVGTETLARMLTEYREMDIYRWILCYFMSYILLCYKLIILYCMITCANRRRRLDRKLLDRRRLVLIDIVLYYILMHCDYIALH